MSTWRYKHRQHSSDNSTAQTLDCVIASDEGVAANYIKHERARLRRIKQEAKNQPKPVTLPRFSWDKEDQS